MENLTCDGKTVVVNLHGALLSVTIGLSVGMRISIHVYLTDKRAKARVVYVDPEKPLRCGIELDQPQNIWGVPLPPGGALGEKMDQRCRGLQSHQFRLLGRS